MTTRAEHTLLHEVARIATLRIPGIYRIAEICACLRNWVSSVANSFLWFNRSRQVTHFYLDKPDLFPAARAYFEQYYGTMIERQYWTPAEELIIRGPLVDSTADYGANWANSPMYRNIFARHGIPHITRVVVARKGEVGRGELGIHSERPLNQTQRRTLERLIPYLNQALDTELPQCEPDMSQESTTVLFDTGEIGVVFVDQTGAVVQTNESAQHLIHLAFQEWLYEPGRSLTRATQTFNDVVRLLVRRLANPVAENQVILPEMMIDNIAGRFVFRAERLCPGFSRPDSWTCITIKRRLPLPLLWHRAVSGLKLSPLEKHVCLLQLENVSQPAIAAALRISPHTVVSHVRHLYQKLGVTDRAGLSTLIMWYIGAG